MLYSHFSIKLKFLVLLMHYLLMIPCWLSLLNFIFSSPFDEKHIQRTAVKLVQGLEHKPVEKQMRELGVFRLGRRRLGGHSHFHSALKGGCSQAGSVSSPGKQVTVL